jgi:prefoldin subunit 5
LGIEAEKLKSGLDKILDRCLKLDKIQEKMKNCKQMKKALLVPTSGCLFLEGRNRKGIPVCCRNLLSLSVQGFRIMV